jgi:hypothetical protein
MSSYEIFKIGKKKVGGIFFNFDPMEVHRHNVPHFKGLIKPD